MIALESWNFTMQQTTALDCIKTEVQRKVEAIRRRKVIE